MSNKIIKEAKLNTTTTKKKKTGEVKRMQQSTGTSVGITAKGVLLTLGAVAVVFSCVYVGYDQLRTKPVMTVEGQDGNEVSYSIKDLGYYVYEAEAQGESMSSLYAQFYGEGYDYWNAEMGDDGSTAADVAAETVISEATEDFILYQQAVAEGYSATDEDNTTVTDNLNSTVENMTKKQKMIKGLSEKEMREVILKQTIGERYKKDKIASLGIDYDAIKKGINKKDYKQYDFQYYMISTKTETDEGQQDMSKEEKAAAKEKMEAFLTTATGAEDFATILGNDENGEAITQNEEGIAYHGDGQLIEKDGFDAKIDKAIKKLKVGDVSEVLEGEDGYYIIKMTDDSSTASYDNAVQEAINSEEESAFDEEYTTNIEPNYTVNVDYDVWDTVKIGNYSL